MFTPEPHLLTQPPTLTAAGQRVHPLANWLTAALIAGTTCPILLGQDQPARTPTTEPAQPEKPSWAQPGSALSDVRPPAAILGQRIKRREAKVKLIDALIIVPDPLAALSIIRLWPEDVLIPVLIDDQTLLAKENIARFIRGYNPKQVILLGGSEQKPPVPANAAAPDSPRPTSIPRPDRWESKWADQGANQAAGRRELLQSSLGPIAEPLGVVAVDLRDEACVAAVALAKARGELLIDLTVPNKWTELSSEQAGAMAAELDGALAKLGVPYAALGDPIDAVTLVGQIPGKVKFATLPASLAPGRGSPMVSKPGEALALTDLIGREFKNGSFGTKRWAWSGQIGGTPAEALYRVMCGLCLSPSAAAPLWGFDGYATNPPWNIYSIAGVGDVAKVLKLPSTITSSPDGTAAKWIEQTGPGLRAGVVMVNTMGNSDFFDLKPGRGLVGDVPLLFVPSAVYFIHSWSATDLGNWWTVGSRWANHGAYAYVGSVHEPFLQAFVPPLAFAQRSAAGLPIAAAARFDDAAPWRIGVFADPLLMPFAGGGPATIVRTTADVKLFTVANAPASALELLGLASAPSLEQELATAIAAKNVPSIVLRLVLLGRDEQAAKLLAAALSEPPATRPNFPHTTLGLGALAAHRAGKLDELAQIVAVYAEAIAKRQPAAPLNPEQGGEALPLEALWQLAYAKGSGRVSAAAASVMADVPRPGLPDQLVRDAQFLGATLRALGGSSADAKRAINRWADGQKDENVRRQLREVAGKL